MFVSLAKTDPRVYHIMGDLGPHYYSVLDMGYLAKDGKIQLDTKFGEKLCVKKKHTREVDNN